MHSQTKTVRQTEQSELEESVTKKPECDSIAQLRDSDFQSAGCAVGGNSRQRTRVPRGSVTQHTSFLQIAHLQLAGHHPSLHTAFVHTVILTDP